MILKYSATNVPILQLGLSSPTLSELPTLSEARPSLEFCLLTLPETRLTRGFCLPTLSKVRAPCENRLPTLLLAHPSEDTRAPCKNRSPTLPETRLARGFSLPTLPRVHVRPVRIACRHTDCRQLSEVTCGLVAPTLLMPHRPKRCQKSGRSELAPLSWTYVSLDEAHAR
jgi:hypothetical protein